MDFVITACDQVAGQACPAWPGAPVAAHWNIPDPGKATGDREAVCNVFLLARNLLQQRIGWLMSPRIEALDRLALGSRTEGLGC